MKSTLTALLAAMAITGSAASALAQAVQWRVEDGGNGHWYETVDIAIPTWEQARDYAAARGGHLVTITTEEERAFLAANVGWNGPVGTFGYVGLFQDHSAPDFSEPAGGWRWVTGEPVVRWPFCCGEPNDAGGGEDWAITYGDFWVNDSHVGAEVKLTIEWDADCNGDGIVDYGQILNGQLADANNNGIPDICEGILVSGAANIFGAGHGSNPAPGGGGGGVSPVLINLQYSGSIVHFPSVTGLVNEGCCSAWNGPDGFGGSADYTSWNGIAGLVSPNRMPLVGVFLTDSEPVDPAPDRLNFASIGIDFASLSPSIGQVFFIGDGRRSDGSLQDFVVPVGATRLFLGIADAGNHNGLPGAYDDNQGAFAVTVATEPPAPCTSWALSTPASTPPVRFGFGMAFDAARSQSIIFGGLEYPNGPGPFDHEYGDTWVLSDAGWIQRGGPGPSLRSAPTMAYDPVRQRTVLFGGTYQYSENDRTFYNDTWEWDGTSWTLAATSGPSGRSGAGMAYDPQRGKMVLAGGVHLVWVGWWMWESLSDCWEWDGSTWVQSNPLPVAISGAPMAYDANRQRLIMFSGGCGQLCGFNSQTFERSDQSWVAINAPGPAARSGHMMAYSPELGGTVLFGGTTGNPDGEQGDTWLWDGSTWNNLALNPSPSRREAGGMVYDSTRQRLVMLFGFLVNTSTYLSEQWELSVGNTIITSQPQPVAWNPNTTASFNITVAGPVTAYQWRRGGQPLPNGGRISGVDTPQLTITSIQPGDAGTYDCIITNPCGSIVSQGADLAGPPPCALWTLESPAQAPSARELLAMAYDSTRGVCVLFGGATPGAIFGDTWEWNGSNWTQWPVSGPSPRQYHAVAFDSRRGVTVLFGGTNQGTRYNDTWEWNGTVWTQRNVSGPSPRGGHAMAYDAARGVTVLFGGNSGAPGFFNETWEWNGATWSQRAVTGPGGRSNFSMVYDTARQVVVLFGGTNSGAGSGTGVLGDTWEWDGATWTQRATSGPAPREYHSMVYDSAQGTSILFGGYTNGLDGETWDWNGSVWNRRAGAGPSPRYLHSMAYDATRNETVLFGGSISLPINDINQTWTLTLPQLVSITTQPQDVALIPNTTATFNIAVSGPVTAYQWRRDGQPLTNTARITGVDTPSLTILNVRSSDQGTYDCIVTDSCGTTTSQPAELSCRPVITQQPAATSLLYGGLQLSLGVPAGANYSYRWRYNGQILFNVPGLISGATTRTLTFLAADASIAGSFDCVVTNACGTTTSAVAEVYCPSDFNQDGSINSDDISDFISGYFNDPPDARCDFNTDGVINADDLGDFITAYFNGC